MYIDLDGIELEVSVIRETIRTSTLKEDLLEDYTNIESIEYNGTNYTNYSGINQCISLITTEYNDIWESNFKPSEIYDKIINKIDN